MNEENNIALNIQTRILPQIEGAQEFQQALNNIPNQIQQRLGETISSPGFQAGITPEQIKQSQDWMKYSQGLYEPIRQNIQEMAEDLEVDLSAGGLTKGQKNKYKRKIERLRFQAAELGPELLDDAKSFMGKDFDSERIDMFRGAIKQARMDIDEDIKKIQERFEKMADGINKSETAAKSFFQELRQAGVFAVGGMIGNEAMKWIRTSAEIEGKERTAFDLTSPLGMYGEQRGFDVFESTRQRERLYGAIGMGIGTAGGYMFGGPIGAFAGGMFGSQIGGQIAGIQNIGETSRLEEEMKILNQSYGSLSNIVMATQQYDILQTKARARIGDDAYNRVNLGYMPEQELQMRMSMQDTLGKFDEGLFKEQTTFARATGLDPNAIYGMNISGRVTGADYSIKGLDEAQKFSKSIFGTDAGPQRIIDVLNELKTINEQMLRLNVDADARESMKFANLPANLFGIDNPYGRLGDLGGSTIKMLEQLMIPKSEGHEAFLYQALGEPNLMKFTEMMKGGIYSGDNLEKILGKIKDYSGGSEYMSYFMLQEMMPNAPQGFIPDMATYLSGGTKTIKRNKLDENGELMMDKSGKPILEEVEMSYDRLIKEMRNYEDKIKDSNKTESEKNAALKEAKEVLLGFTQDAKNNISSTESYNANLREIQMDTAGKWRSTIYEISTDMVKFWNKMGDSAELHKNIVDKANIGLEGMIRKMVEMDFLDIRKLDMKTIMDVFTPEEYKKVMKDKGLKYDDDDDNLYKKEMKEYEKRKKNPIVPGEEIWGSNVTPEMLKEALSGANIAVNIDFSNISQETAMDIQNAHATARLAG